MFSIHEMVRIEALILAVPVCPYCGSEASEANTAS